MKILFISSYVQKNAGSKALLRLAEEIKKEGHQVKILTTTITQSDELIEPIRLPRGIDLLNRIFNTIIPNYFSLSHYQIINFVEKYDPDVINIHWTHGYTIPVTIFPKLAKNYPIFWTQHDLWAIHTSKTFEYNPAKTVIKNEKSLFQKFISNIRFSPKILYKIKVKLLSKLKLNIVSPSKWMMKKIKDSPVFKSSNQIVIPNGVRTDIFKPKGKVQLRNKYGIPKGKNVILFLTANLADQRKGAYFFIEAMKLFDKNNQSLSENTVVLTVGKGSSKLDEFIPQQCVTLGSTSSDHKLAEFYNLADIFVSASIADNFPSTSLESISCGVPVIAFNIGGLPEIIEHKNNGLLVEERDIDELSKSIEAILTDEELRAAMSREARKIAVEKYDISKQADRYIDEFSKKVV